jgi:hypothetical protein
MQWLRMARDAIRTYRTNPLIAPWVFMVQQDRMTLVGFMPTPKVSGSNDNAQEQVT